MTLLNHPLAKYNKLLVALVGAVATVLVQEYANSEWVQAALPFLTALGVYSAPNKK